MTEKALLSMVRQTVGYRDSQGEADRYRDRRQTNGAEGVLCGCFDSSVQVSWAVRTQQRGPHSLWEWGGNSAITDSEPKSFCYKRRKIKTNLTKCIVLV